MLAAMQSALGEWIMGWRFRRSVKLLPGIRLNFSRSGITTTLGPRGAHVTVGGKRARVTTGIPGTGISYTTLLPHQQTSGAQPPARTSTGGALLALLAFAATIGFCNREHSTPPAVNNRAVSPISAAASVSPPRLVETSSPFFVAVDALNARDAPNGRLLGKISRGEMVSVFETADGWARISATSESPRWVSFARLCSTVGCYERTGQKAPPLADAATASPSVILAPTATSRPSRAAPPYASSCPCSGPHYCVGPRGGVYCITSGGNKRYTSHR